MLQGGGSAEPTALSLLSLSPRLLLPLLSDVKKHIHVSKAQLYKL